MLLNKCVISEDEQDKIQLMTNIQSLTTLKNELNTNN